MRSLNFLTWVLFTVLFASYVEAKPRSMAVDTTFDNCGWAAEVTIVAVGDAIRVRVTGDPDAIFRGHQLLGTTLELQPIGAGEQACLNDLRQFAGAKAKLLMVTDREGRVQLVGSPKTIDDSPGYHLRTWFDYNATWFYSNDKKFGRAVGDQFDGVYGVTTRAIAARFASERKQLMLSLATILLRPRADLPEAELVSVIAQLGDDEFYIRERAQRQLLSLNPTAVEFLQQQARLTDDLEIANRLGRIIRVIQSPLQRHATGIRDQGAEHEARVLMEAHEAASDQKLKTVIVERLTLLAEESSLVSPNDAASPESIIATWREALD